MAESETLTRSSQEEDFLRYLLSDSSEGSSPDSSPALIFDHPSPDSSDASPAHWSTDGVLSAPEISINLDTTNPEMLLYGSPLSSLDCTFPLDLTNNPSTLVPTPTTINPNILSTNMSPTTSYSMTATTTDTSKRSKRSNKRPRPTDPPLVPSPESVVLPRDALLQISSQNMEKYVETLQQQRSLSLDEQKELKRQKRLIKNRESAQLSRERKRAYIDQLEQKVAQLVSENNQLKNENTSLRQALAQFQTTGLITPKPEPLSFQEACRTRADGQAQAQHATKMAGLLNSASIGGNRPSNVAKAGVCLLIVLFSFGLFMNANQPGPRSRVPSLVDRDRNVADVVPYEPISVIAPKMTVQRSLLEAQPEVRDEDVDMDDYQPVIDEPIPKSLPALPREEHHKHLPQLIEPTIEVKPAGIFKVSYSSEPASFTPTEPGQKHSHNDDNTRSNKTYLLFLEPHPDMNGDLVDPSPQTSSNTGLQVSSGDTFVKKVNMPNTQLPPMIISLVVPAHIANGSNPLLPPNGVHSRDSLVELTCQLVDISITTSERSHSHNSDM